MAVAVIVGFQGDRISHEHIYWDQAGVLVQTGLLDPAGLPVTGAESARNVLNPKLPSPLQGWGAVAALGLAEGKTLAFRGYGWIDLCPFQPR